MKQETTSLRRCDGAGEQSRGMPAMCSGAIAGRVPLVALSVVAVRCYEAMRRLTVERVQRSCGGFSEDDVSLEAGLMWAGDAIDELGAAGWVRFAGFDDEEDWVVCHALVDEVPVGMQAGETRYGERGLVALEVVGVPVRRVLAIDDELSWLWARQARLWEVRVQLADERRWGQYEVMCARLRKVSALSENLWRRWAERHGAAGICKTLVVWGSHGGRGGHGEMRVVDVLGKGGVA